jgi:hypothetical protein
MGKINDLKGARFGKLVVIEFQGLNNHRKSLWLCKCDCGNKKTVVGNSLSSGLVVSCGCYLSEQTKKRFTKDIANQKFGKLTVIKRNGSTKEGKSKIALWLCLCECGNEITVRGSELRNGRTKSCGCLQRERASIVNSTHKMSKMNIYATWVKMLGRCNNPNINDFKHYGGRGIKVCDDWLSFEKFYEDFGKDYKEGLTIDRIDVNDGYNLDNCRWATRKVQGNNTRRNKYIEYKGEILTIAEIADKYHINYSVLYKRLKRGWDIHKAVSEPIKNNGYYK